MPDTVTIELIYSVLQSVQTHVAATREDIDMIKNRLTALEIAVGNLAAQEASHYALTAVRADGVDRRLDRIEKRLELAEERA